MVRNEADIVEAFVRHNLSILDGLLVIDHGSADTTLDILTALCRERVPLVVMKNEAVGYMQQAVMTQAVRHVFANTRADFVFPLDADEFLKVMSRGELERALAALPPDTHGLLSWPTFVPDLRRPACDVLSALRGARRAVSEAPGLTKAAVARRFLKAMDEVLSSGNHRVEAHPDAKVRGMRRHALVTDRVAAVAHVPIRSVDQFIAKVAIKKLGRIAANIDWKPDAASQVAYEALRAGMPVDVDALEHAAVNWSVARSSWRGTPP
ncbi:MAG: glycosyltransferase family 2 protein [Betaproteobacteria bacterium]|nr:glycosyltransferase family 2 protein [Betaproteobacteria bacterium]